jgi:hypothetical protein
VPHGTVTPFLFEEQWSPLGEQHLGTPPGSVASRRSSHHQQSTRLQLKMRTPLCACIDTVCVLTLICMSQVHCRALESQP